MPRHLPDRDGGPDRSPRGRRPRGRRRGRLHSTPPPWSGSRRGPGSHAGPSTRTRPAQPRPSSLSRSISGRDVGSVGWRGRLPPSSVWSTPRAGGARVRPSMSPPGEVRQRSSTGRSSPARLPRRGGARARSSGRRRCARESGRRPWQGCTGRGRPPRMRAPCPPGSGRSPRARSVRSSPSTSSRHSPASTRKAS